jgi:hypothetical protein
MSKPTAQNGKGSKPRPIKDHVKYASNFDVIFGNKEDKEDATDNETAER